MTMDLDRRAALTMAGVAMLGPAMAKAAPATRPGKLAEMPLPPKAVLPNTRYFEIDSGLAGARYAIFVTTPTEYGINKTARFPVIYTMDGNSSVLVNSSGYLPIDPIAPIEPFISVAVGYPPDQSGNELAIRARDLIPPNEPPPPGIEAGMDSIVQTGRLDRAGADLYAKYLRNPAGDRFLAFLEKELHPLIATGYRVDETKVGLFGYSYGGLFAVYVALQRSALFRRIGSGSPGIMPKVSSVFADYGRELKAGADHGGRMLHLTVCSPEITFPSYYQPLVGMGSVEFITLAGQQPLKGLKFSSRLIEHESHFTGDVPSWNDFLRTCYSQRA